jgi:Carboxypeptidase regulatory-like domain
MANRVRGTAPLLRCLGGRLWPAVAGCGLGILVGLGRILAGSPLGAAEIRITGRVVLPGTSGTAIASARVELRPAVDGYEAARRWLAGAAATAPLAATHPAPDGSFALMAPQPGCYRLTVSADGFLPLRYPLAPLVEDRELPAARLQPATRSTIEAGAGARP